MLTFNAERHEYRWEGRIVPGVTQVLDAIGAFANVPADVLEAARDRGTDVHLACQFFDEGDLDEDRLRAETPHVVGYLEGWKKFTRDCKPQWTEIEKPVFHRGMRFAGTPDRMGSIVVAGERLPDVQVDIKSSAAAHPIWGVQLAAYAAAANRQFQRRFTCQLRPDGTYRLIEWDDPSDLAVFCSLATLRAWKERHRL